MAEENIDGRDLVQIAIYRERLYRLKDMLFGVRSFVMYFVHDKDRYQKIMDMIDWCDDELERTKKYEW